MSQGYLPNKIQCFCGKFRRLGRSRSVLLPALASQGLSSRTGQTLQIALTGSQNRLQPCKILPEYSFHESMYSSAQNAKPRMTPKGHCPAEAQQRVEEFATQLSCHPNPAQHAFKEHQLGATLLRCASLQCTSVGPCKTWPFVHDQPLARRLQLESRMTCKALLASEDAQRASLLCFYLLSSS